MLCRARVRTRPSAILLILVFGLAIHSWAEDPSTANTNEASCSSSTIISVPSRPTVTNATDTTQCGAVEVEYGLERQWPGGRSNRDDLFGGLRLGITHNLDFHWASGAFVHVLDATGDRLGYGDNWLGVRYKFLRQTKFRPSLGVFYEAKVPSASVVDGLGTGRVDHSLSFLASKDRGKIHFDFNVIQLLAGRTTAPGFDKNTGLALSASLPLTRRISGVFEAYGYTFLNPNSPAFASLMAGVTYQALPRLALDSGFDLGVTPDAPRERVYVGITYAIANVYSWLRPRH